MYTYDDDDDDIVWVNFEAFMHFICERKMRGKGRLTLSENLLFVCEC